MINIVIGNIIDDQLQLFEQLTQASLANKKLPEIESLPEKLMVDLSVVKECDSIGIASLIWLLRKAQEKNCQIFWKNIPNYIEKILSLYKLNAEGLIQDARKSH